VGTGICEVGRGGVEYRGEATIFQTNQTPTDLKQTALSVDYFCDNDELQKIFDDLFNDPEDPIDFDRFCNEVIEEGLVQTAQADACKSAVTAVKDSTHDYAHADPPQTFADGRRHPKTEVQTEDFEFDFSNPEPMFGAGAGRGSAEYLGGNMPSGPVASVNNSRRQHSPYHQVPSQSPTDEVKFMPNHHTHSQFSTYQSYSTPSPTSDELGEYFFISNEDPVLFDESEKIKDHQFEHHMPMDMMMEVSEETVIDTDTFSQYDFSSPEDFSAEVKHSFQNQEEQQGFGDNFDLREFL
jgi:hypothetical protein